MQQVGGAQASAVHHHKSFNTLDNSICMARASQTVTCQWNLVDLAFVEIDIKRITLMTIGWHCIGLHTRFCGSALLSTLMLTSTFTPCSSCTFDLAIAHASLRLSQSCRGGSYACSI